MSCSLCHEENKHLIQFGSNEATKQQIPAIVFKHLPFCFNDEPRDGYICKKCWSKVNAFHRFYIQIEQICELPYKTEVIEPIKEEIVIVNESQSWIKTEDETEEKNIYDDTEPEVIDDASLENDFDENGFHDDDDGFDDELNESSINETKRTKIHKKKHNRLLVECEICKKSFPTYAYKAHQKQQHPDYPFRCYASCPSMFKTAKLFQQHKLEQHKIQCNVCGKFIVAGGMRKHVKLAHENLEKYQKVICDSCGRLFLNSTALKYHVRAEHEVHERLQCDICKEWLKNKENLRAHMKTIHIQGPKTCDICGRVSTNSKSLAKHKKIHLERSKEQFKCIVCLKGFRDRTKLKEHSYIHSGITDAYSCSFCGRSFRFGSSYYSHRKKEHSNEMNALKIKSTNGTMS